MKKEKLYEVLEPHIGIENMFEIVEDGTSQTSLTNKGRFGFWVEGQFKVIPNRSQDPDLGNVELKSVMIKGSSSNPTFKDMAIGNITWDEFLKIRDEDLDFKQSLPYRKAQNTLTVFYRRTDEYWYCIERQMYVSFSQQSKALIDALKQDYKILCEYLETQSYNSLGSGLKPSTKYLTIKRKGDAQYTYPCWHFTKEWTKAVYNAQNAK